MTNQPVASQEVTEFCHLAGKSINSLIACRIVEPNEAGETRLPMVRESSRRSDSFPRRVERVIY